MRGNKHLKGIPRQCQRRKILSPTCWPPACHRVPRHRDPEMKDSCTQAQPWHSRARRALCSHLQHTHLTGSHPGAHSHQLCRDCFGIPKVGRPLLQANGLYPCEKLYWKPWLHTHQVRTIQRLAWPRQRTADRHEKHSIVKSKKKEKHTEFLS